METPKQESRTPLDTLSKQVKQEESKVSPQPGSLLNQKISSPEDINKPGELNTKTTQAETKTPENKKQNGLLLDVEVLPNRSWLTNFFHNYALAVERANTTPAIKHSQSEGLYPTPGKVPIHPAPGESARKEAIPPFQSILTMKYEKPTPQQLQSARLDTAVVLAFREIIGEQQSRLKTAPVEKTEQKTALPLHQKASFQLPQVPFHQFEKLGVTQEQLLQKGMLDKLLKGGKTIPLENISLKNGKGETVTYSATFQLEKKADGSIGIQLQHMPVKPELKAGHRLTTPEGSSLPSKEPSLTKPGNFRIPTEIKGVKLSDEQQKNLKEGKDIQLSGLTAKDGTKYDATVRVDMAQKALRFANPLPSSTIQETTTLKDRPAVAKVEGVAYREKPVDLSRKPENYLPDKPQPSKGIRR